MAPLTSVARCVFSLLLLASPIVTACGGDGVEVATARSDQERELAPSVTEESLATLSAGNRAFAFDLYQAVRDGEENLFYSPYSISVALAMAYAGARGETAQQMAETMHYRLPQEHLHPAFNALDLRLVGSEMDGPMAEAEPFTLQVANSLWGQRDNGFLPEFLDLLAENYGSGLRLVDFTSPGSREQARLAINQWVSDQTQERITDLIPEDLLTKLTRLVLANAIYFKAEWRLPFRHSTNDEPFQLLDGEHVIVPTMSRRATTPYLEGEGFQALELAYKGERASLVILLPAPGQFMPFEQGWDADRLDEILQGLQGRDIELHVPKFEYETALNLAPILSGMGMVDAFDQDLADFAGMDGSRTLYISHVLHKAFVAVNEQGTEAAAATGVVVERETVPFAVRVDRPFLYLIRDSETNTILFMGRVLNPLG